MTKPIEGLRKVFREKKMRNTYAILRLLCGSTRFKIIAILARHGRGTTVTELARILEASPSRISHQLRILKQHNLVSARRKSREVRYILRDQNIRKYLRL